MQKSKFLLVAMILMLGMMVFPVSGQAQFDPCGHENVDGFITTLMERVKDAQAASSPKESVAILAAFSSKIIALQGYCNKWSFAGDGPALIQPIDLPKGTYIAVLYVFDDGPFEATIAALNGDCHEGMGNMSSKTLFSLEGKASNAQAIIDSSDCSASIKINFKGSWQLIITHFDAS